MYSDFDIHEVPLRYAPARKKVADFLGNSDLRVDDMDYYTVVTPMGGDDILAAGGLSWATRYAVWPFVPTVATSISPTGWCRIS